MSSSLFIYGATGFTGRLITDSAVKSGLRPRIAGRTESKVRQHAEAHGLECDVTPVEGLADVLSPGCVLINAAGPFRGTAVACAQACIRAGAHYLDVSGEVESIDAVRALHDEAVSAGVLLMPAVGFDVVASDCLAAYVALRVASPRALTIGISGLRFLSRGSARTAADDIFGGVAVRRGGALERIPSGSLRRSLDYGTGPRPSTAVSWGDVVTAYYTTGIPDITVFFEENPINRMALLGARLWQPFAGQPLFRAWVEAHVMMLPEGPTEEERAACTVDVLAEVESSRGERRSARLRAPEAYTFTSRSAVAVAQRVLAGDIEPGFQTPGRLYGPDFVLGIEGVERVDEVKRARSA